MTLREMFGRLAAWRRRDELERELSGELEAHLDLLARDFEQQGMRPDAARAAARRQLGNVTAQREESREAWGFPALTAIARDLHYALRGLRHSPGFTIAAVLTLGLGIGANAAMFGVIDRLMFRPFPHMRDPGTVHRAYFQTTYQGRVNDYSGMPYARYVDIRRESTRFAEHAAVSEWRFGVGGGGDDVRIRKVAGVSASLFAFFDAPPLRGRYFVAAEDSVPNGTPVAVIGHTLWATEFGSSDVLGRALKVGRITYTVIGVAPDGFIGAVSGAAPDVFVPISTIPGNLGQAAGTYDRMYNWDWMEMLVRRKPGVSEEEASADLTNAWIRSRNIQRATNPRMLPDSLLSPRAMAGPVRIAAGPGAGAETRVLLWVTGVAVIVLLIACASVANLMLARVIRRRKEITVRLALGVGRRRLAAQFITESLLIASLGTVAGLLVAQWSGIAIRGLLLPEGSPFNLAEDWRTLSVALACAAACTLLTAVAPALVATRSDLAAMLKAGGREGSARRTRMQSALLVTQVALSAVLLVGAGLFVRSFGNARAIPLGYDVRPVIEVIADFRGLDADSAGIAMRRRFFEEAKALPGVLHATQVNGGLFRTSVSQLRVPGIDSVEALGRFNRQVVSADYFHVMATRIVRGRALQGSDRVGAPPVVVVSEAMARRLWSDEDALGKCMHIAFGQDLATAPCATIVGISENTANQSVTDQQRLMYYLPAEQVAPEHMSTFLLRMAGGNIDAEVERVRRELTRAMPGDGFVVTRRLQEVVDDGTRAWRLGATLFVAFGGLAFIVAVVGLYGVISYDVAGRTHELGIRAALGAQPAAVVRLVVAQGVRFVLVGVAIGGALSFVAARWMQPLLFEQSARDPLVLGGVGALMVVVGVAASAVPALRASRADPASALRSD
jgi:predicted permease